MEKNILMNGWKERGKNRMELNFNKIPPGTCFKFEDSDDVLLKIQGIEDDVRSDFYVVRLKDGLCAHISNFGRIYQKSEEDYLNDVFYIDGKFVVEFSLG